MWLAVVYGEKNTKYWKIHDTFCIFPLKTIIIIIIFLLKIYSAVLDRSPHAQYPKIQSATTHV